LRGDKLAHAERIAKPPNHRVTHASEADRANNRDLPGTTATGEDEGKCAERERRDRKPDPVM
jgi:hypothetical protein